jgi:hypothetical protein
MIFFTAENEILPAVTGYQLQYIDSPNGHYHLHKFRKPGLEAALEAESAEARDKMRDRCGCVHGGRATQWSQIVFQGIVVLLSRAQRIAHLLRTCKSTTSTYIIQLYMSVVAVAHLETCTWPCGDVQCVKT